MGRVPGSLDLLGVAVLELAGFIAELAAIDGAVVLDREFEFHGFGAEITSNFELTGNVARAVDLEGDQYEIEDVEGAGTRHRSAYRLCSVMHDALVVTVRRMGMSNSYGGTTATSATGTR